jgi:pyruvate formate lyase activating enzyme
MEKHKARYWHSLPDDIVQCELCPHHCVISPGQRGICFVRQNIDGELIQAAYGRSSGFAIDPIEKKPLYHFYPGSDILSFGTIGCNLGCKFCQNCRITKINDESELIIDASPEMIARTAKQQNCRSVAFTYNEPTITAEYSIDTANACHALDIKTVAVTAGYIEGKAREDFFEVMDAANVDLKGFTESFYRRLIRAHLQPVLDTLIYIKKKTNVWLEITNLIIPEENDKEEEIKSMCEWIAGEVGTDVPLHFSAFHPAYQLTDHKPTGLAILKRAYELAKDAGLKYVYLGNVRDEEASATYCPKCNSPLILRHGYSVEIIGLQKDKCAVCGQKIDIVI